MHFITWIIFLEEYLSQESVEILIHTLIYCNSLYLDLPDYQIQKIQRGQNAATRVVYNAGKYCHITPLLFKLHWPPIHEPISFKILITHKAVHWHAPNYIKELNKFKKWQFVIRNRKSENIYYSWRPRISSRHSKTME